MPIMCMAVKHADPIGLRTGHAVHDLDNSPPVRADWDPGVKHNDSPRVAQK